ncbi:MAG: substrate-binding domain-containing protein [Planctomycetes bacterium]|nr:substrate-binding domain-containing protein [Planctomycetota bacterium]
MSQAAVLPAPSSFRLGVLLTQQGILAGLVLLEFAVFSDLGRNFLTARNGFEVARLSVEIGLLALAMTPVIITGGIDLSVGSLMGLAAVLFGKMWRDAHLPIGVAAVATLGVGFLAGSLNGVVITRLRLPPLIVTLGSYSLFRGLAEGLTGGVDNFTNFPDSFTFLGQDYLFGWIPAQLPIFLLAAVGFWILLHRTTIGRGLFAIGFSPEGARYAGIPVERRLRLVYVLSGLTASLAAIIFVAHVGQAKADAGTGYELLAITAVVLGGTSIFGGRGSILGTLLGLVAIAVLKNGLQLAFLPAELAGILTGGLLLASIILEELLARATASAPATTEELKVKNSQVAVICGVILLGALIIAASNLFLIRALQPASPGESKTVSGEASGSQAAVRPDPKLAALPPVTVAMMPKSKGNAYFIACRKGAEEAAQQTNVKLIWDGPTSPDPAKQSDLVDTWITSRVDVIAVAVENQVAISSVLQKARKNGIKVLTWDADADANARDFFVNQGTPKDIGYTLMDDAAKVMGNQGDFAIITASLTAANMNEWQKYIEERRAQAYPNIKRVALEPCDDKQDVAFDKATAILNSHPTVKLIMAICSPAVPGAAEAVKQSKRTDVKVVGLGLPNDNKDYVHAGITPAVVLWKTMDLGYLTVYASQALQRGALKPGDKSFQAGRLDTVQIEGDNILLGKPFTFTKDNIDQFNF